MLICVEKINFITHFFLKILERNSKLVILSNLDMTRQPKVIVSIWRNRPSADKKSTSSFTFSLRYCKDTVNLFFWVIWACLATHNQSDNINLWKTFVLICRQKINFIPHAFLEILQRYANFSFWILWICLITHT